MKVSRFWSGWPVVLGLLFCLSDFGVFSARAQPSVGNGLTLSVERAPFSYAIASADRTRPLLAESRPDTSRSSLYFITDDGVQYLTESLQFDQEGDRLDARYRTTDGREATVEIVPAAAHDGWRVSVSFDIEEDILRVGEQLAARPGERFHGLSERARGNNDGVPRDPSVPVGLGRRGHHVEMDLNGTISLYAPFYLSSAGYGLYAESTWLGAFDMAKADPERVRFAFDGPSLTYHVFPGTPERVLEQYTGVVGRQALPPNWTFGTYRWRDNHSNRDTLYDGSAYRGPYNSMVYEDVAMTDALDVPLDVYWVDRPWAKGPRGYDDFEWDPKRFPEAQSMIDWLNGQDRKFLVWIAPFVLGDLAQEALRKDYFLPTKGMVDLGIKRAGSGKVDDLDFLRSLKPTMIDRVQELSTSQLCYAAQTYLANSCNDAPGERSEDRRAQLVRHIEQTQAKEALRRLLPTADRGYVLIDFTNPEATAWWQRQMSSLLKDGVAAFKLDRAEEFVPDARDAYAHNGWSMARLQNYYPVLYAKAAAEAAQRHRPGDYAIMPRAGWPGSQKHANIFWAGDTAASWLGLRNALIGGQRAALMGYPFWGSDTGGYGGTTTGELLNRWLGLSAFSPFMEVGPIDDRAPWDMGDGSGYNVKAIAAWRLYSKLHKHLQDYIQRYAEEAHETGHPVIRPLFYEHPDDEKAWVTWDQYYFGEDYLVAPVIEKGAREREVYLPDGQWVDYWQPDEDSIEGPTTLTVEAPVYKTPIFLRAGSEEEVLDLESLYQESLQLARSRPDIGDGSELLVE